jgi:hypothetical protein
MSPFNLIEPYQEIVCIMNVSGQGAYSIVYAQAPCICLHITTTLVVMRSSVVMCRQMHVLFHSFTSLFDTTIYLAGSSVH